MLNALLHSQNNRRALSRGEGKARASALLTKGVASQLIIMDVLLILTINVYEGWQRPEYYFNPLESPTHLSSTLLTKRVLNMLPGIWAKGPF